VRSKHGESAAGGGQLPRGHRKRAGDGPHRPDHHRRRAHGAHDARGAGYPAEAAGANASRRLAPGSARIPRRDIVSTLTSRDAGATGNPARHRQPPAITPGNTVRLTHPNLVHARNASRQYGHADSRTTPARGATSGKPTDCRTRMRADRPDLHAQRVQLAMAQRPCRSAGLHAFSLGCPSLSVTLPSCTSRLTFQCGVTGLPGSLQVAGIGSQGQWGAPPGTRTRTCELRADKHKKQHPYRHKPAILPAHRSSWVTYSQVSCLCPVLEPTRRQTPNFPALAQEKPRSTAVTEFPAPTPQRIMNK